MDRSFSVLEGLMQLQLMAALMLSSEFIHFSKCSGVVGFSSLGARYQNHPDIGQRRAVCPCKVSGDQWY